MYPIPAPNGSQIIIYGHEQGLTILWRGGRPLKPRSKVEGALLKVNGRENSAVMILDSDNEEQPTQFEETCIDKPEFEDEESEFDPNEPYYPIVQDLDLVLGTAVLHLSTIDMPYQLGSEEFRSLPSFFRDKVVVALSCSDRSIKILTLPLAPPSLESKMRPELLSDLQFSRVGSGSWGEQIVDLSGNPSHQTLPKGVSMTLSSRSTEEFDEPTLEPESGQDQPYIQSTAQVDLLITSHSADVSGLVLIHKITISPDGLESDIDSYDDDYLWRIFFLAKPAITVQLHVPTSSAKGRYPWLLVAEERGPARVFSCQFTSISGQDSSLLSLYPGTGPLSNGVPKTKQLLDAKWVLGGQGIAIICADGEWGIWDTGNAYVLNGSIPTKFTVNGWMGSSAPLLNSSKVSAGRSEGRSTLAPMTPGTRKVKQEALFAGTNTRSSNSSLGGICIQSRDALACGKENDESMVIWHGDHIMWIPSLQSYWETAVKESRHLLGPGSHGQLRQLILPLGGGLSRSVTLFPLNSPNSNQPIVESDLLVTGERTLLIIASPIERAKKTRTRSTISAPTEMIDQQLLARGELGVGGMDRILADMANDNQASAGEKRNGNGAKRKVLFASP